MLVFSEKANIETRLDSLHIFGEFSFTSSRPAILNEIVKTFWKALFSLTQWLYEFMERLVCLISDLLMKLFIRLLNCTKFK